jgi:hypothetical protein
MHRFDQAVIADVQSLPPIRDLVILGQADQLGIVRGGSHLVVSHGMSSLAQDGREGCTRAVWNGVWSLRMAETLYIPSRPIMPISTKAPFFIVATTDQPRDGEGDTLGRRHTLGEDERKRFAVRRMGFEALRRERVEEAIAGLRVR